MASYHHHVKAISRSAGRSATGAAAYRSGEKIADLKTGLVFDYTKKKGVVHSEIIMPPSADKDFKPTGSELWNMAESAENRKDACVAREREIALPKELTPEQRLELARNHARDFAEKNGCAVQLSIHAPHKHAGKERLDGSPNDNENHHVHLLCTTRKVEGRILGEKCLEEKSGQQRSANMLNERKRSANLQNVALARYEPSPGAFPRVDHRTLEAQGIDHVPQFHKGVAVVAMERKGIPTDVGARLATAQREGEINRAVARALDATIVSTELNITAALAERSNQVQLRKGVENEIRKFDRNGIPDHILRAGRAAWNAPRALAAEQATGVRELPSGDVDLRLREHGSVLLQNTPFPKLGKWENDRGDHDLRHARSSGTSDGSQGCSSLRAEMHRRAENSRQRAEAKRKIGSEIGIQGGQIETGGLVARSQDSAAFPERIKNEQLRAASFGRIAGIDNQVVAARLESTQTERKNHEQQLQRAARHTEPADLTNMQSVFGCDNIHDIGLSPKVLLQPHAPAELRQQERGAGDVNLLKHDGQIATERLAAIPREAPSGGIYDMLILWHNEKEAAKAAAAVLTPPQVKKPAVNPPARREGHSIPSNLPPAQPVAFDVMQPKHLHPLDVLLFRDIEKQITTPSMGAELLAKNLRKAELIERKLKELVPGILPFDYKAATQSLSNLDFDRERETINAEAKARGIKQNPYPTGQNNRVMDTYDHHLKGANERLEDFSRTQRPAKTWTGNDEAGKLHDKQLADLQDDKAKWVKELAWRDKRATELKQASDKSFSTRLDELNKEHDNRTCTAIEAARPTIERVKEFAQERKRIEALATGTLSKELQRELEYERGRSNEYSI